MNYFMKESLHFHTAATKRAVFGRSAGGYYRWFICQAVDALWFTQCRSSFCCVKKTNLLNVKCPPVPRLNSFTFYATCPFEKRLGWAALYKLTNGLIISQVNKKKTQKTCVALYSWLTVTNPNYQCKNRGHYYGVATDLDKSYYVVHPWVLHAILEWHADYLPLGLRSEQKGTGRCFQYKTAVARKSWRENKVTWQGTSYVWVHWVRSVQWAASNDKACFG